MSVFDDLLRQLGGGQFGDPSTPAMAPEPMGPGQGYTGGVIQHLQDVISGKVAAGGALGQNNYDPNQSLAQNALNPKAIEQASEIAGGIGPGAIRAYHGSPHSFDRFDINKIGTGEGAQAYGHGLYFAEAEDVARQYRDALQSKAAIPANASMTDPRRIAGELYDSYRGQDIASALDDARFYDNGPQIIAELRKLYANPPKGHMYEVDIHADPKALLDWDRPLAQQPGQVQRAVEGLFAGNDEILSALPGATAESITQRSVMPMAGYGRGGSGIAHDVISEELNRAGIPGIRYLDQGSRIDPAATQQKIALYEGLIRNDPTSPDIANWANRIAEIKAEAAKPQTSNYAIFDPKIIEILRKYGILPPLAAGGLLGGLGAADVTVVPFKKPDPRVKSGDKKPRIWVCLCRCEAFWLYEDGSIQCMQCEEFHDGMKGVWSPVVEEPPAC